MQEVTGKDFWQHEPENGRFDARVIPCNGFVYPHGGAELGGGVGGYAVRLFPNLPRLLGKDILENGNKVHVIKRRFLDSSYDLCLFPTKNHFADVADRFIISRSVTQLVRVANQNGWTRILMAPPGINEDGMQWNDVRRIIRTFLDERFYIFHDG